MPPVFAVTSKVTQRSQPEAATSVQCLIPGRRPKERYGGSPRNYGTKPFSGLQQAAKQLKTQCRLRSQSHQKLNNEANRKPQPRYSASYRAVDQRNAMAAHPGN